MEELRRDIGERLKAIREKKGVTQKDLGDFLGYSSMAISHFENGLRELRIDDLRKVAKFLNAPLESFLATTLFRADHVAQDDVAKSLVAFDKHVERLNSDDNLRKN